jgi:hypothetical protein
MSQRINARIGPELAEKLAELSRRTGKGTTDLIQTALERYYDEACPPRDAAASLADFIGCAEGPRTLSTSYKTELRRSLLRKT